MEHKLLPVFDDDEYHKSKTPFRQNSENTLKAVIYKQERNFEQLTQLSRHQTTKRIITVEVSICARVF